MVDGGTDTEAGMNYNQRLLVVAALVVIGVVLTVLMLNWGNVTGTGRTPVLSFYVIRKYETLFADDVAGIYTRHGLPGILLGVITPLCLFALAAFVLLGTRKQN
jgi:hypothetical protein